MLRSRRTYRFLSAFLAGVLFLAGLAPLVQHACAQSGTAATLRCCCAPQHEAHGKAHEEKAAHHGHDTSGHDGAAHPKTPCHTAAPAAATLHHPTLSADGCCGDTLVQSATPQAVLRTEAAAAVSVVALPAASGFAFNAADVHADLFISLDTGPPIPRPVPLHILHAAFLI